MNDKNKEEKKVVPLKTVDVKEMTSCESTAQMLEKARRDDVETAFDRAVSMKACPIGADSACCKHCSMGPCRLNPKDLYGKVGVCGATICQSRAAQDIGDLAKTRRGAPWCDAGDHGADAPDAHGG